MLNNNQYAVIRPTQMIPDDESKSRSNPLNRIKNTVSQALDIATDQLNEISLEDIEIDQASQHRIYQTLYDMAMLSELYANMPVCEENGMGVPCTGFWVEDTRELILFAWSEFKSKTIVVPPEEWFLREDITIH